MSLMHHPLVLVPLLALAACDSPRRDRDYRPPTHESSGEEEEEDDGDDEVAMTTAPIVGPAAQNPVPGVVKVTRNGQADTHTGVAIGPGMVVTSARWLDFLTLPRDVGVVSLAGTGDAQTRAGAHINSSPVGPLSLVSIAPFAGTAGSTYDIDMRSSASLTGELLRCFEYVGDQLRWADMRVSRVVGDELEMVSSFGTLEDADAGAPCLDLDSWTIVGMSSRVVSGSVRIHRLASQTVWLDGMRELFATRDDARSTRLSLYTVAPDGRRMCLDIPGGTPGDHVAINVYPCHYGPNQRFWLDFRADSSRPRMISEGTGRCMDIPSGLRTSGTNFQTYGCHAGWNQRFELTLWGDAAGGWKLRPSHAPALCLSVEGGPTTSARPTEQRTCNGGADQRWYPAW